jgi:hypothetical protein
MSAFGINPMSPGAAKPMNTPSQGTPYGAQSVSVGGQQRMVQAPAYGPPQGYAATRLAQNPFQNIQWNPQPANYRLAPDFNTNASQQAAYKQRHDELAAQAGYSPQAARQFAEYQQMLMDRDQQPMPGMWYRNPVETEQERRNYLSARELDALLSKPQRPVRPGIDVPDANGMIMNSAGRLVPFQNHGAGGGAVRSSPGAVRPTPAAAPAVRNEDLKPAQQVNFPALGSGGQPRPSGVYQVGDRYFQKTNVPGAPMDSRGPTEMVRNTGFGGGFIPKWLADARQRAAAQGPQG